MDDIVTIPVGVEGGSIDCYVRFPGRNTKGQFRSSDCRPPLVFGIHGGPLPPMDKIIALRDSEPWLQAGMAYCAVDYRASGVLGDGERERVLSGADVPGAGCDARDVNDAVNAVLSSPWAEKVDQESIVIYGFSYGAYVLNRWLTNGPLPSSITLAVCHEGVADLRTLDEYSLQMQTERRRRSPEEDPEHWRAASPIERAHEVGIPVLLSYGENSAVVDNGRNWRDSLREAGARVEWLECANEGHLFSASGMQEIVASVKRILDKA